MDHDYITKRAYYSGLAAVENSNHLWGFVNEIDEQVISCQYHAVRDFHEGFAGVYDGRACGFINREGVLAIPCIYKKQYMYLSYINYDGWWPIGDFHDGLAPACKVISEFNQYMRSLFIVKDVWGYIDTKGNEVINFKYYSVGDFKEGRAIVSLCCNEYDIIDKYGNEIAPYRFFSIGEYRNGLALVKYGQWYGYINNNGVMVIPCQYYKARSFSEGLAFVLSERQENEFRIIDTSGNTVLFSKVYNDALEFSEGLLPVRKGKKWGFIDKDGVEKILIKYDCAKCFVDGIAKVELFGIDGMIDKKGRSVVIHNEIELHMQIDIVGEFKSGYALINHDGKYGLIDNSGSLVVDPDYDFIGNLFDRLVKVSVGGIWENGGSGYPNQYSNGKYGLIEINGVEIVPCVYNLISEYDGSFYRAEKDNIFFLIGVTGKVKKYEKKDWLCLKINDMDNMSSLIYKLICYKLRFFSESQLMKLIHAHISCSKKIFIQLSDEAIGHYISNINICDITNMYEIFINAGRTYGRGDKSDDAWIELVSITGAKKPYYKGGHSHEAVYDYKGDVYLESLLPYYFESIFYAHHYSAASEFNGVYTDKLRKELQNRSAGLTESIRLEAIKNYKTDEHHNTLRQQIVNVINKAMISCESDIIKKDKKRGIDFGLIEKNY